MCITFRVFPEVDRQAHDVSINALVVDQESVNVRKRRILLRR
jgi:hypothetical protein